jgi:alpha-D-ribose 1-methylphosphonate 5-triphosphate synthase subunit PhnH
LDPVATGLLLSLLDCDSGFFLSESLKHAGPFLSFHTGARERPLGEASFAAFSGDDPPESLSSLSWGTENCPDLSATIILCGSLDEGESGRGSVLLAKGPGVKTPKLFSGHGLSDSFVRERALMQKSYPLGVDVFLTGKGKIAALPRTLKLEFLPSHEGGG